MKIERYISDQGEFRCFAVENRIISRAGLVKVLGRIQDINITKHPRFWDDDIFCEFEYRGMAFVVEEPYGDNTTYDLSSKVLCSEVLEEIASHFEAAAPIKGGDSSHTAFVLVRGLIAVTIISGVVWAASQLTKCSS